MSTVNIDYFTETASVAASIKLYGGWYMRSGQAITGYPTTLTSVKFYLKKVESPTGTAHAFLSDISGTFGSTAVPSTVLATSADMDISEVSATDYSLEELTFSSKPGLGFGFYNVGIKLAGDGTVDATSYLLMARNKIPAPANKCHLGNSFVFTTAGSYVYQTGGNDVVFYAYGSDEGRLDPSKFSHTVIQVDRRTVKDILRSANPMIKASAQAMKNAMLEKQRIANMEAIRNQRKIKKLKK